MEVDLNNVIPVSQAKPRLGELVRRVAADDEELILTRHGHPVVVLMSYVAYENLIADLSA